MRIPLNNLLLAVFFLSGFSGLVLEVVWIRYLKLSLGHAAYAQVLTLTVFMGGMALGARVCGTCSHRWPRLLKIYALTEAVIGVYALFFHWLFNFSTTLLQNLWLTAPYGTLAAISGKVLLATLLLAPPTFLLGMTFPLMAAGMLRLFRQHRGRTLARLYCLNTLGGVCGVLLCGFWLIGRFGLPGTLQVAGVLNLMLALVVWQQVGRKTDGRNRMSETLDEKNERWHFLLVAALITGTASLIYELGWIRLLSFVLGSSSHAFELMLSAFLLGLAGGSWWLQKRLDKLSQPLRFLAWVQIVMGLCALVSMLLYNHSFAVMQWLLAHLDKSASGYLLFNLSSHAIALAVMLPATFCAGLTLPLITLILLRSGCGERSIGAVYAANTVGAIIGIGFAFFWGFTLFGLKGMMQVGAALDMGLGLILLSRISIAKRELLVIVTLVAGLFIGACFFIEIDPVRMASGVFRCGQIPPRSAGDLLFQKDGRTATISITRAPDGTVALRTNGKIDAGIQMETGKGTGTDDRTTRLLAALPMALHPAARTVANIGLGSGLTSHTFLLNPTIERVTTIEIEKQVVNAAHHFQPLNHLFFDDPRSKIVIDDAKTYFAVNKQKFDIIVSEPSNPWVSGIASLFSREFYHLIRQKLKPGGLFVQWLQLYETDQPMVISVLKALAEVFPDYAFYSPNLFDLLIVAGDIGAIGSESAEIFHYPKLKQALQTIAIKNLQDLNFRKSGNRRAFEPWLSSFTTPANSDFYSVLECRSGQAHFLSLSNRKFILAHSSLPAMAIFMDTELQPGATDITMDFCLPRTRRVRRAMALRDFFRDADTRLLEQQEAADVRRDGHFFRNLFLDQEPLPPPERRLDILFDISIMMLSYLHPDELSALWQRLESANHMKMLTPTERRFVTLFKAIGARDGQTMARLARHLLPIVKTVHPFIIKYLLATGMLGSIMIEEPAAALKLWDEYQQRLFMQEKPEPLFDLLLAHSSLRSLLKTDNHKRLTDH